MDNINLFQPVKSFVDKLEKQDATPLYELSPEQARLVLREVQKSYKLPEVLAETSSQIIDIKSGRQMPVLIIKPKQKQSPLPIIFYIHGGGWVMGDETTHNHLIRVLANSVPAAVVFPIYTQSPEAQYPQTTDDLFEVLQHIVAHAEELGLDAERLIVAGDSVGATMATVMTMLAKRHNNKPQIDFQLLLYPVTDDDFNTPSYKKFANGPWLTKKAMEWFWKQYAPDKTNRQQIFACPLKASVADLEDLPSALVITAENDVLRDEGEAYAKKLDEAGVVVGSMRINGTIHDFLMLNALAETEPTREALSVAIQTMRDVWNMEQSNM